MTDTTSQNNSNQNSNQSPNITFGTLAKTLNKAYYSDEERLEKLNIHAEILDEMFMNAVERTKKIVSYDHDKILKHCSHAVKTQNQYCRTLHAIKILENMDKDSDLSKKETRNELKDLR